MTKKPADRTAIIVRRLRWRLEDMSVEEFARALRVTTDKVNRWEAGEIMPINAEEGGMNLPGG